MLIYFPDIKHDFYKLSAPMIDKVPLHMLPHLITTTLVRYFDTSIPPSGKLYDRAGI